LLNESDTTMVIDTESDAIGAPIELPRTRSSDRVAALPAFLDDEHLLGFQDDELVGYDLASGASEEVYTATDPITVVAVQGGRVFLGLKGAGGASRIAVVDAPTWTTASE